MVGKAGTRIKKVKKKMLRWKCYNIVLVYIINVSWSACGIQKNVEFGKKFIKNSSPFGTAVWPDIPSIYINIYPYIIYVYIYIYIYVHMSEELYYIDKKPSI